MLVVCMAAKHLVGQMSINQTVDVHFLDDLSNPSPSEETQKVKKQFGVKIE